jgi:DNA-binding CsgD family transcriptional regulator
MPGSGETARKPTTPRASLHRRAFRRRPGGNFSDVSIPRLGYAALVLAIVGATFMPEPEWFSALIGTIYDAALEPALWDDALPRVARFVGGPSAAVWSEDLASTDADVTCVSGVEAGYVEAYLRQYANLDPTRSAFSLARPGEPFVRSRVAPDRDFVRSVYYRDWMRPQGLIDCMHVVLDRVGPRTMLCAVSRHKRDGDADEDMHRRMRVIAPHLRRATLIGRAIAGERRSVANFTDMLDHLSTATILVDARGRVAHANAAAHALIAQGDLLSATNGRLRVRDADNDRALQDVFFAASAGDCAIDAKGISLPLVARDGEDYIARVLPLAGGARQRAGGGCAAVAAVFVTKAELPTASLPEVVARRFKLTPMEVRVLMALLDVGGGIHNVADALGMSAETVKTHLGHLYEKTGAKRQADLVRLALRFSNPSIG